MSRALKTAVLAVAFLASAALAGGRPEDLFDAAAKDAFAPGQKEMVLALDGGRFTIRDGRLHDAFVSDPRKALLTNAQFEELVALRVRISALPAARPLPLDRKNPAIPKGPGAVDFDGGGSRGDPGAAGASGAREPASADPAVLQAQLLSRLRLSGTAEEKKALAEALDGIFKTKLGRTLARQFVEQGATAAVTWESVPGTRVSEENGIKVLGGERGSTDVESVPPRVKLNRAFLDADPEWRRLTTAGTLAHELFGHAFETQRAKKAGVPHSAHYYYRGDELGARLISWTIRAELAGAGYDDDDPGEYLEDPEGYAKGLWTYSGYYAVTLSPAEMKNPSDTLKERLKAFDERAAKVRVDAADMADWTPIIAHFKSVHRVAAPRLDDAEKEVRDYALWSRDRLSEIAENRKKITDLISYWRTPAGMKEKGEVIRGASAPYFAEMERLQRRRALDLSRLRAQIAHGGRGPSSTPSFVLPPLSIRVPPGAPAEPPISLEELGVMYRQDKKDNPKH